MKASGQAGYAMGVQTLPGQTDTAKQAPAGQAKGGLPHAYSSIHEHPEADNMAMKKSSWWQYRIHAPQRRKEKVHCSGS